MENTDGADQEQLDEEPKSIILSMIKQLKYGMDLHRVTFPTFVLEPRSMLERITDFMSHQDLLLALSSEQDAVQRFLGILRYYMSGWHVRPKGVRKPYNPVLGEIFRCRYKLDDGSESFYVAEQVSHHPPISAYFFANPKHRVVINGYLAPKSKFLGNSVASIMEGRSIIRFLDRPDETYVITMPNMYARGILFGTMLLELCDNSTVVCEAHELQAEIEFKAKGYFTGTYNAINANIKRDGYTTHKLSGKWSDELYLHTGNSKDKDVFFSVDGATVVKKTVLPEDQQEEFESRRLWSKVSAAIIARDQDAATTEKTKIEDHQRKLRSERGEHHEFKPRFFTLADNGSDWTCLADKPDMSVESLEDFIFKNPPPPSA